MQDLDVLVKYWMKNGLKGHWPHLFFAYKLGKEGMDLHLGDSSRSPDLQANSSFYIECFTMLTDTAKFTSLGHISHGYSSVLGEKNVNAVSNAAVKRPQKN